MRIGFVLLGTLLLVGGIGCGAGQLKVNPTLPALDLQSPLKEATAQIKTEVAERTDGVVEQLTRVQGQVGQLQTSVEAAAEQAEFRARASTPLFTFAAEPPKSAAGTGVGVKVDQVLGELSSQGQRAAQTLQKAEAVARQVQDLVALAQEIRTVQQAIADQQPGMVTQQGPAGILGLVSLILAILLRRNSKQHKGK